MGDDLENLLREQIKTSGPMPVDQWMSICLGHPEHGYYTTGQPFGKQGDFTTAPEISQMFGELLGLWAAVVWQQMGSPDKVQLIELGPGRGTLMSDALRAGKGVSGFLDAVSVSMVETSPVFTALQKQALADARVESHWYQTIEEVPTGPSMIVGNEFLDALPIRQWVKDGDHWRERCIDVIDGHFEFVLGDQVDPHNIPEAFRQSSDGDIFETSPVTSDIVQTVSARLCQFGGAAVFIDYGHLVTGLGETLQAVKKHEYADPLQNPGQQDLTAHVNFAAVAKTAREAGARAWGPITQGELLERLGISARVHVTACACQQRAGH
jgi:NADH dehydrogenase [ubiquinone] 1 alpha subcomplex assembly factor 7